MTSAVRPAEAGRLARTTSVYTLGTVAVRGAGLLLIPIYWRALSPTEYGIVAVADIIKLVLSVFLGLGISEALTRYYHSWPSEERAARLGTVWIADWATSLLLGVPFVLFAAPLTDRLITQVPFDPYLRLAALVGICVSLSNTPLDTLRILELPWHFVACSVVSFLLQAAAAIWLVVFERRGAVGLLQVP